MRLIPLKQWLCDSCGEVIEDPEDGWFEWHSAKDYTISNFRIVHHRLSCMYNEAALKEQGIMVADHHLSVVIGSRGLAYWLFAIELSETGKASKIKNLVELVGILRRLHIPYWEEARLYWDRAYRDGFHDGCDFGESNLQSIIEEYEGQE